MAEAMEAPKVNRRRRRISISADKRAEIANRVIKAHDDEVSNRKYERDRRLQRYAKYRLWSNGTDWPWPDASDVAIPDMLQDSLRVQDTLHNAVMSQRPPVVSRALHENDADKQLNIDRLIDYQLFVEQQGEHVIGEMAEAFTNDPMCVVFVPWIREKSRVSEIQVFGEIPEDQNPRDFFFGIVREQFPTGGYDEKASGWEWTVSQVSKPDVRVCFYTNEADEVEMVIERDSVVYDGPRLIVKDYDDVVFPARSANLQPPGPANPGGAPFVVLRDTPRLGEIKGLKKSGYYDLLTQSDIDGMSNGASSTSTEPDSAKQKDTLSGANESPKDPQDKSHKPLTRLMCFDRYDIDGDGYEEDVIFWVIRETKTLVKARLLSDLFPGSPPLRPLAHGSFLPVGGRASGMSCLEIMEAMHDATKVIVDQFINGNDMAIGPTGFYRPSGSLNPEVLRSEPFSLFPLQNPQQDIVFPQMGNTNAMGAALNMITMLGQWQDKVTMVSDMSFGQVPKGGSSALRTIGGMSMVNGQGEARPERILRRFFMLLTAVWQLTHRLNQSFLPKGKEFLIAGASMPGESPYAKIGSPDEIRGDFEFGFDANVLNTSKAALQDSLERAMKVLINPLAFQLGVTSPEKVYNLLRDYVKALGQPADRYVSPPKGAATGPSLMAEDAIRMIMQSELPIGQPAEPGGVQEHMQKLQAFMASDNLGLLSAEQVQLLKGYIAGLMREMQNQQNAAAADQFSKTMNQGTAGAPVTTPQQAPSTAPPPISGPTEMMDETMPTAGGGANAS